MHLGGALVGVGARASAGGASGEVTAGDTSGAVTGDTWAGTGGVLEGPASQGSAEVADEGAVVDLLWAAGANPAAVVVDLLWAVADREAAVVDLQWAVAAVVAGRVEALEVAERGLEAVPRVLVEGVEPAVEAAALVVAEPVVVAEALAVALAAEPVVVAEAAVAASFSEGCGTSLTIWNVWARQPYTLPLSAMPTGCRRTRLFSRRANETLMKRFERERQGHL
jgi:hypothetical protein